MSTLTRRRSNPIADLLGWLENETGPGAPGLGLASNVRIEDFVEDDTYVLRAELPGIDPDEDVAVDVTGEVLTIRGQRREQRQDRMCHELRYGPFSRTVPLPRHAKVDAVTAAYRDGVLELRVPLDGEGPHATRVLVQRAED